MKDKRILQWLWIIKVDLIGEVKGGFPCESMIKLNSEEKVGKNYVCYCLELLQFHYLNSEFLFDHSHITF